MHAHAARGTHNAFLCSAAKSGHVGEDELLASGTVRGPVLRLSRGTFEAQHYSHFDSSGATTYTLCLPPSAYHDTVVNTSMATNESRSHTCCGRNSHTSQRRCGTSASRSTGWEGAYAHAQCQGKRKKSQ